MKILRNLLLGLAGLSIIWTARAQIPVNNQVIYVPTAPTGACPAAPPVEVVISTGAIYTCDNGPHIFGIRAGDGELM